MTTILDDLGVNYLEFDNAGSLRRIMGCCRAKDFHRNREERLAK